jgi:hypothetical protein
MPFAASRLPFADSERITGKPSVKGLFPAAIMCLEFCCSTFFPETIFLLWFVIGQWRLTVNLVQCAPASEADSVSAALLPNANVLIEDGNTASEFYDPSTNVWQATLNQPNVQGPLALLTNGQVLTAGVALVSGGFNAAL